MMKLRKNLLALSICALLPVAAPVLAAEEPPTPVTADGGTINFNGSVVTTACAVSADSTNMNVDMGQIRTAALSTAGSEASSGKAFSIKLTDCDASTYTGVAVTFSGTADETDASYLQAGSSGSSAQNVAIRLYDASGNPVKLGTASDVITLRDGDNSLNFSAKYASPKGGATAGDASAVATYTLTYS